MEYLASATVIDTHDLDEAREAVTRIYLRHDLLGSPSLNMRLNAVTDRRMTVGYLTYQADAELVMPPTEDCYVVNVTIAGATAALCSDGTRERTAPNAVAWSSRRYGPQPGPVVPGSRAAAPQDPRTSLESAPV